MIIRLPATNHYTWLTFKKTTYREEEPIHTLYVVLLYPLNSLMNIDDSITCINHRSHVVIMRCCARNALHFQHPPILSSTGRSATHLPTDLEGCRLELPIIDNFGPK